mmetsp:Transcript_62565/g.193753  ORF Transcript_62565/g.193753 Transcript_62565/m.193753 type:complete len:316 (+) Transcript_62565:124-1071(+)
MRTAPDNSGRSIAFGWQEWLARDTRRQTEILSSGMPTPFVRTILATCSSVPSPSDPAIALLFQASAARSRKARRCLGRSLCSCLARALELAPLRHTIRGCSVTTVPPAGTPHRATRHLPRPSSVWATLTSSESAPASTSRAAPAALRAARGVPHPERAPAVACRAPPSTTRAHPDGPTAPATAAATTAAAAAGCPSRVCSGRVSEARAKRTCPGRPPPVPDCGWRGIGTGRWQNHGARSVPRSAEGPIAARQGQAAGDETVPVCGGMGPVVGRRRDGSSVQCARTSSHGFTACGAGAAGCQGQHRGGKVLGQRWG